MLTARASFTPASRHRRVLSPLAGEAAVGPLLAALDELLVSGGDGRLAIDPATGLNPYGCRPSPHDDVASVSSSTATSISGRAYHRGQWARALVLRRAADVGLDRALDERMEAMRVELKSLLGLAGGDAEIVFSASGTHAQLQALFVTRAALGAPLTVIVVASDQTGGGTAFTARGRHFSDGVANAGKVAKDDPVAGLSDGVTAVSLPLISAQGEVQDPVRMDAVILEAVRHAIAQGDGVLLQVMDASKFGWRAPSDPCLDEIAATWPGRVQIVVDACQMRLGQRRLARHLRRGSLVLATGSKFFTGPPFSGALFIPPALFPFLDAMPGLAHGLADCGQASDWPARWPALRAGQAGCANLGQWLRWEAALEEIDAYSRTPVFFRHTAFARFSRTVRERVAASPSLRLLPAWSHDAGRRDDDDEFASPTIVPFTIQRDGRELSAPACAALYRALQGDATPLLPADIAAQHREIAQASCLLGQPVTLRRKDRPPTAALRVCADARVVSETWSDDPAIAQDNLSRRLAIVSTVFAKVELLAAHVDFEAQALDDAR